MKKVCIVTLIAANISALFFLFSIASSTQATPLTVDDLMCGQVDVDGDGKYTVGDDSAVLWLSENAPHVLEEAVRTATVNSDGGVDLSPYLMSEDFDGETIYHRQWEDK